MKINIELEEHDFEALSEVLEKANGQKPTEKQALKAWEDLPHEVKVLAVVGNQGCANSDFMDSMYDHLLGNDKSEAGW